MATDASPAAFALAPAPTCWGSEGAALELQASCCSEPTQLAECALPAMMPLRAACCGDLVHGVVRLSPEWEQLQLGIEAAVSEMLRIVEETESAADCREGSCDPFMRAAEVALSSSLSPIFHWGWLDLIDDGEFSIQAWRVALLQVALTWISLWHRFAFQARELFRSASTRWWQLLHERTLARWSINPRTPGAVVHLAMVASVGVPAFGQKAMAGIRSALFFASRHVRFHLVVDRIGEDDVKQALKDLDPKLQDKGSFRFYQQEELVDAWREIRALVPEDCLQFSSHYGSAGWLRLFPHLVVPSSEAEDALIWIDAGDYVFLADPAELAEHLDSVDEDDFLAVADTQVLALPMQLFSLRRLRQQSGLWVERLTEAVHQGYAEKGGKFCGLGEGFGVVSLLHKEPNRWMYHELPHHWTYMPWAVWLPSLGTGSLWASYDTLWRLPADPVWSNSVFPGLSDFTTLRVKCPAFLEDLANYIRAAVEMEQLQAKMDQQSDPLSPGDLLRKHFRMTSADGTQIMDEFKQRVGCDDRIKAVHLPVMFHEVPWVHRFLNFWAGAEVWQAGSARFRELRRT